MNHRPFAPVLWQEDAPQAMPEVSAQVPVAVVGAGACGLTAALVLAEAGIDCVVIERDAQPAGSTALSSGFIPAAGTQAQRRQGIEDSPALFAADIQHKAGGQAAPHLVQAYTEAIAPALDFLEQQGLTWQVLDGFLYPGHSRHRMHCLPERTGAALMAALGRAAEARGVPLLCRATARTLVADAQRRIRALQLERPDGARETIACDALLLACNGFGGDAGLRARFLPAMAHAPFAGHVGNDGSAVRWGEALGAPLADMAACQGHGSWAVPQGALISWALMVEGGIQVNARGERFHDESQGYSEAAVPVLAQPGGTAWCVFDDPILALARSFPDFVAAADTGALRSAADVAGLAAIFGCDARPLQQTLEGLAPARTDPFGRTFTRALQPPYHAVRVTGALFHTQGGLDVDAHVRVRGADGGPLPNLWAAGGAARGVSGPRLEGYLSGNGLLSAVAGGWIAGHDIARRIQLASAATSP
jgi:fumarate reductase flavoprotein subunit